MEVSTRFDGSRVEPSEPDSQTYAGEEWKEVPLARLRAAEARCRVP